MRKETKEEKVMSEIYGAEHLLRLFGGSSFSRATSSMVGATDEIFLPMR
jgi:hypothetical protein